MGLRERLRWFGRLAMLIFVLASVTFLSAITAMRFAIQGGEVKMPDLVGKKSLDAAAMLQKLGLGMRVEDRAYSLQPVDAVVRQSPPAGIRLKIGQRAHVVLSLGPQRVTIPNLDAMNLRTARIELLRGGMQVGELSSLYLPGYAADIIVQQDPAPGTSNASSPHVDVLLSLGPRPKAYVMPDLVGLSIAEAEAKIAAAGFPPAKLTVHVLSGAPGAVAAQTPSPGARVDASTAIELEVAE